MPLVGRHQCGRCGLFAADRLVDPLAHVGRTAAALGILTARAEDIDGATGAGPDGGIDITLPDGPTNAKVHVLDVPLRSCDLLAEGR